MSNLNIKELKKQANIIREDIVKMIIRANSGHIGGSLGMADIFTVLFFKILNHSPHKPNSPLRDRLILSNGHICPVLYTSLARAGYFPLVELKSFCKINSRLQGHPHNLSLAGVEVSSGPLGQGISQAVGIALNAKIDKSSYRVFCITSDGEHNEGQVWEALMLASKYKLNNLIVIVDLNGIQINGYTKDIMPLGSLTKKYQDFGWNTIEMPGNDIAKIVKTLQQTKNNKNKPLAIIAKTTLGKGVSFMENKYVWHDKIPDIKQSAQALEELEQAK